MKRLVSIFLSLMILLCCVIPVSAATSSFDSSTNGYSLDITPYLDQSYFTFSDSSNVHINASFDSEYTFNYVDIVFTSDASNIRIGTYWTYLTVLNIKDNLYRAFGRVNPEFSSDFHASFESSSGSFLSISKVSVFLTDYTVDYIPLNYSITGRYSRQVVDQFNETQPIQTEWLDININSSAPNPGQIDAPHISPNINIDGTFREHNEKSVFVTFYLYFDWTKFDRVDLYFNNNFSSIKDYSFYVGSTNVLSSIEQVFIEEQQVALVSLDFSDLNRNTDNQNCYIRIRGYTNLNSDNSTRQFIYIHNAVGFVKYVSSNFWPSWLMKIIDKLDNIFTGRGQDQTAADSFNDSVADQSDELEDLTADLNSVTRPPLSDVNLSTSGMVDQSVVVLSTNGIGSILSNQIILRVLIMSLTFALAGFILFGKR